MLHKLEISNFKNISQQDFDLQPLTILTGLNSTGKSSVIQSILLLSYYCVEERSEVLSGLIYPFKEFEEIRNKYNNAKLVQLCANGHYQLSIESGNGFIKTKDARQY